MQTIVLVVVILAQFGVMFLLRGYYETKIDVVKHANEILLTSNEKLSTSFDVCENSKRIIEETSSILMEDTAKVNSLRETITKEMCDVKWQPSLYLVDTPVETKNEVRHEAKYINPTDTFSPDIIRLLDKAYNSATN